MERPLLALVGPTASGKTEAAVAIAERLDAEIVSVDSMSVYRGMDVGTAKPSEVSVTKRSVGRRDDTSVRARSEDLH